MSRPIVTIPTDLMRVLDVNWDMEWRGQPPASTVGGIDVATYNRFPRFIGAPSLVLAGDRIARWRAVRAAAGGRTAVYQVPMIDPITAQSGPEVPYSEGQFHSAGQGFEYRPTVELIEAAAAGDTSILIDETGADFAVKPGAFLSYNFWPFTVTSRIALSDGQVELGVAMLRTAIPAGSKIEQRARGLFVAADDQMGNPAYGLNLVSRAKLSFVEYLDRD
ncbi:MAG: hypothetical protein ABJP33_07725 [Pseudoruegeria sp.]